MLENVSVSGSGNKVAKAALDKPSIGVEEYAVST